MSTQNWNHIIGDISEQSVYSDEHSILFCGDCKEIIRNIAFCKEKYIAPSLIVTDPPYEFVARGGGMYKDSKSMEKIRELGTDTFDFDKYVPQLLSWQSFISGYVNAYFFCNKSLIGRYIEAAEKIGSSFDILCMERMKSPPNHNGHYNPDIEYIIFIRGGGRAPFNSRLDEQGGWNDLYSKIFRWNGVMESKHPNEKPISIMKKFISVSSLNGGLIIDPFIGSGTTAIAARDLNRLCIGIDKDMQSITIAIDRLSQMTLGL